MLMICLKLLLLTPFKAWSHVFPTIEEQAWLPQAQKECLLVVPISPGCHEGICIHEGLKAS